ncbi:MAG: glycosyltransferase family 2 protein [Bacteroidales bacterium]|nr:glycosyltransferase family 2 protein [Bacteroidales bacterium]
MTKLSVIVPVYNTRQYLSRCIDSILNQSFTDFELLLIDDGSTDGSGGVCDAYAEKDGRVRVFHKENGGVSSARNLGLNEARGEWVCFVDSDDELMRESSQIMVNCISDTVDMVMAGYEVYDDNGALSYSVETRKEKSISAEAAVKEMYKSTDYRYQGYICSKLLRRSIIKEAKLSFAEDVFFNEDRLFIVGFIFASERNVYYTTVPVYKYYERAGSVMMSLMSGFNPRFVTDMDAQIKMREMVRLKSGNKELRELADEGVYGSYRRIIGMLKEFNYKDVELESKMRKKLVHAIGFRCYCIYEMSRNQRRMLNILKRLQSK